MANPVGGCRGRRADRGAPYRRRWHAQPAFGGTPGLGTFGSSRAWCASSFFGVFTGEAAWAVLPPAHVYYAVGQSTANDLRSGTTLTFSSPQTDPRLGVGCRVSYGTSNVCYLAGKLAPKTWSCVAAKGAPPLAAAAGTVVTSIRHAFASLSSAMTGASAASYLGTADLVAGNFVLNVPCYYTGPDVTPAAIGPFTTGPANYVRVYTPTDSFTECNQNQPPGSECRCPTTRGDAQSTDGRRRGREDLHGAGGVRRRPLVQHRVRLPCRAQSRASGAAPLRPALAAAPADKVCDCGRANIELAGRRRGRAPDEGAVEDQEG